MRAIDLLLRTVTVTGLLLQLSSSCMLTGHTLHLGRRNPGNDTVQRRWTHMEPGDPSVDKNDPSYIPFGQYWPGNTLIWCFEDPDEWNGQLSTIRQDIEAAWKLWIAAGVDEQVVIFREGDATECVESNKGNVLMVREGSLFATLGRADVGNYLSLSTSSTAALGDRIANFAHEIGHAWGMFHEHQRSNMWSYSYEGGRGFTNTWIFNCQNVDGYDAYTHGLSNEDIDEICHRYTAAKKGKPLPGGQNSNLLHLEEWLPSPKTFWEVAGPRGVLGYDEKSIMLYPSTLGGEADPENGWKKKVVYTTFDGKLLTANTSPSVEDAEGLSDMYPKTEPDDKPCLLTDPCSPQQAAFRASQGAPGSCPS